ncbi:MAG: ABC transporter ATP-binding protein [Calditrichaeota bacterium]|nr:ABC transporter ATP-binding protein [Calditrichota bacterium]
MIKLTDIFYSYDAQPVLRNISFDIKEGERLVLLGVNGSGKSTLLKLIDGLIDPQKGSYFYRGHKITQKAFKNKTLHRRFRSDVVLLFQNPDVMIFNPTVYDEIAFGLKQLGKNHIDERVGYWADKLKITPHLKKPPFTLSSGEKQKVCIAALLALEPKVLLLDEPTSNLDPMTTGWLIDFLSEVNLTTLVATHNLSLSQEMGDRVLVLSQDHELIFDGKLDTFLHNTEKLMAANLVHSHVHMHDHLTHKHFHLHDWD